MQPHRPYDLRRSNTRGFSLVEVLVGMTLGLILVVAMTSVYLAGKSGSRRQTQLSSIQQSVRDAFEFLARDARMVGHLGCFTGRIPGPTNNLSPADITNNYANGIEGYEYTLANNAHTLASNAPANDTSETSWTTNTATVGTNVNALAVATVSGAASGAGAGLTPGSDVLVIRTIAGGPFRLTAPTTAGGTTIAIEGVPGGTCSDGSTAKVSGFCTASQGLIANCTQARVFSVSSIAGNTLTIGGTLDATAYAIGTTEVFPMQSIVYYLKRSSNSTSTSLYRRVFDGDNASGLEQELVENVETLQITYGRDTTTPDADGIIDSYAKAQDVTDWSRVVAVRMSLLIRAAEPLEAGTTTAASASLNGVTVTYPDSGSKYDRRVFTTTVAVRNRIAYF